MSDSPNSSRGQRRTRIGLGQVQAPQRGTSFMAAAHAARAAFTSERLRSSPIANAAMARCKSQLSATATLSCLFLCFYLPLFLPLARPLTRSSSDISSPSNYHAVRRCALSISSTSCKGLSPIHLPTHLHAGPLFSLALPQFFFFTAIPWPVLSTRALPLGLIATQNSPSLPATGLAIFSRYRPCCLF
ncbi:hypothetical protein B0T25DRAFT_139052 [Lasiosphaeria hispida]|uniref:Uncharacterized protein n=1 Tax=Lasiosphaeria hispida TaxID=260671 RepID=A0AAJ0HL54_9PEZI|nr:hypothetical protein B0T25DRAFT_139052 [Lasiosphaeria hispida]